MMAARPSHTSPNPDVLAPPARTYQRGIEGGSGPWFLALCGLALLMAGFCAGVTVTAPQ